MLGLAVTAAVMAMAFVGASSAMAGNTALCATDQDPCASPLTHVHEATLPGNENRAKLLTNIATIQCQVLFLGSTSTGLANPLSLTGNFTYTECNLGCTVTEVSKSVNIQVLKTATELATIKGEGEVLVNCPLLGLHCVYKGEGLVGHGLGPLLTASEEPKGETNGATNLQEQEVAKVSGSGCPTTSKLDIKTTPLSPVYISS
jgi:hypothetical protein